MIKLAWIILSCIVAVNAVHEQDGVTTLVASVCLLAALLTIKGD